MTFPEQPCNADDYGHLVLVQLRAAARGGTMRCRSCGSRPERGEPASIRDLHEFDPILTIPKLLRIPDATVPTCAPGRPTDAGNLGR